MSQSQLPVIIVGASHAGVAAAASLRQFGWTGPITLISEESNIPYQRPPLSKAWLKGESDNEAMLLRPESFYEDQNIELMLGVRVSKINPDEHHVQLSSGETLRYQQLVLALGAQARPLPIEGIELSGVLQLRNALDADYLRDALTPGTRLAIIGGGYIGLEVAASAVSLGAQVVVIEREKRVLARVASTPLSEFFSQFHQAKGVLMKLNADVESLIGVDGKITQVRLSDGSTIDCDYALVGVGAIANDGLARDAGLKCDDGIVVDEEARTSHRDIYAIGDCTHRPLSLYKRMGRLESVQNATEQAKRAASDICARKQPHHEVPWFWSDQFDVRLQIAGLPFDATQLVVRGNPENASFAVFHLDTNDRLKAVEAVNAAGEFMSGKMMIGKQTVVPIDMLDDESYSMKEILSKCSA